MSDIGPCGPGLGLMIQVAKLFAPQPEAAFPPWQGMQYMRDQFSRLAKLKPLDNARYDELSRTSVHDHLAQHKQTRA